MKNIYTLTPVRQPNIPTNPRHLHREPEKEWTAARCQRLLRSLTSRVAILRKDTLRYSDKTIQLEIAPKEICLGIKAADWTKSKKKLRRTYGRSGNHQQPHFNIPHPLGCNKEKKHTIPGEVLVPTPVLARVRARRSDRHDSPTTDSPDQEIFDCLRTTKNTGSTVRRENKRFQLSESLRELRQHVTNSRYNTYKGIYHSLETILYETSPNQLANKPGAPKTLLELALRTIPRYISEQEKLLQIYMHETGSKSAIDDRDISGEIYYELEGLSSNGKGWKRLRSVARAHGVQVICDAIKEGLLEVEFCGTLISLCVRVDAIEEAQIILSSILSSFIYSRPKSICESPARPICLLLKFSQHTNQTSFLYRELNHLISNSILHPEWLATEYFGPIWTGLIQSFSLESFEHEALSFIHTALSLFMKSCDATSLYTDLKFEGNDTFSSKNLIQDAVNNTFSSLLIILFSIVLLHRGSEARSPAKNTGTVFVSFDHIISLLGDCLIYRPVKRCLKVHHLLLLVVNLIINKDSFNRGSGKYFLESLSSSLEYTETATSNRAQIAKFICEVARCCGRGTAEPGFDYLRLVHFHLDKLASDREDSKFLRGIIVESALAFARNFPDHKHIEYAASMNASYCTISHQLVVSLTSVSQNSGKNHLCGLRWEDGIGEWVTSTPAISKFKRKAIDISEDSDLYTPIRQPSSRRRITESSPSVVVRAVTYRKGIDEIEELNLCAPDFSSPTRSQEIDLPVNDEIAVQLTHIHPYERTENYTRQSFCIEVSPMSYGMGRSLVKSDGIVEKTTKASEKGTNKPRFASKSAGLAIPSISSDHAHQFKDFNDERISQQARSLFKTSRQVYLLDSSPCKDLSLDHKSGHKCQIPFMSDDEDELSLLFTTSPSSSNQSCLFRTQTNDKFQEVDSGINSSFKRAIDAVSKINKSEKSRFQTYSKIRSKKSLLRTKRSGSESFPINYNQDGSEDELCS